MKISKIAIVWNSSKAGAEECKESVLKAAKNRGIDVKISEEHPLGNDVLAGTQLCCVIGGDGTILGAVESSVKNSVPIFGINLGKLGYLANYSAENISRELDEIFSGNYRKVSHSLLECSFGNDAAGTRRLALNDVVIKSLENFKIVSLRVEEKKLGLINNFRGDGIIFTTPTGSTAYSLGAGGPLINSEADVFALTPLCPHTLSNRTVVFPRSMEILVSSNSPETPIGISIDGSPPFLCSLGNAAAGTPNLGNEKGGNGFSLKIKLARERVEILQPKALSEFEILRTKLRWA